MRSGRFNVAVGAFALAAFMATGFYLIYMHDLHPDHEAWKASYTTGKHFQTRMAHVHGSLFAFLNIVVGFVLAQARGSDRLKVATGALGLLGLLMPIGILLATFASGGPVPVVIGAVSMTLSLVLVGVVALKGFVAQSAT